MAPTDDQLRAILGGDIPSGTLKKLRAAFMAPTDDQLRGAEPKLYRRDFKNVDGKLIPYNSPDLFVWTTVNKETGEVEMGSIKEFDDALDDLAPKWEWRRFRLVEERL